MPVDKGMMVMRTIDRNQDDINAAERVLDIIKEKAFKEFERLQQHLSREQLLELAERCTEEDHDDKCVYCAAWVEFNARGS